MENARINLMLLGKKKKKLIKISDKQKWGKKLSQNFKQQLKQTKIYKYISVCKNCSGYIYINNFNSN